MGDDARCICGGMGEVSYDLMVFDPKAAPKDREDFLRWEHEQTSWNEDHSYDDPAVTTPELRALFFDMIKSFPAMNGPFAFRKDDDPSITDYSIGRSVIYAAFASSQAVLAYHTMFALAKVRGVGFSGTSEPNSEVWMADAGGNYVCVHRSEG